MNLRQPTAKATDGRRKKRPGVQEQRIGLLSAAAKLFRQQGSKAVSISQICAEADISRPTFYRCFADKDALVLALYEQSVNQPVETIMLRSLRSGEAGREQIQPLLSTLLDTIFDHAHFAELVFIESHDPASPAYAIVHDAFAQIAQQMSSALRHKNGPELSIPLLKAVLAACQWIVHDAIQQGLDDATRTAAKATAWELVSRVLYDGHRDGN